MSTNKEVAERVECGIRLLDAHQPGWLQEIKLNALDVSSPCDCVLGQVYGEFGLGLTLLELGTQRAVNPSAFGFEKPRSGAMGEYVLLSNAWQRRLSQLKKERDLPKGGAQ